jgi:hypothetical protein
LRQLRLSAALLSPEAILFRDKFSFVLGLSLTWCGPGGGTAETAALSTHCTGTQPPLRDGVREDAR